jgi:hypothetical protein
MNKTCADCIHEKLCQEFEQALEEDAIGMTWNTRRRACDSFADKSRYIELPCDKGDVLQYDGVDYEVDHWNILATSFSKDNHLHLFDVKEAEKALKGGAE